MNYVENCEYGNHGNVVYVVAIGKSYILLFQGS